MKSLLSIMAFFLMVPVAAFAVQQGPDTPREMATAAPQANKLAATRLALRGLWVDHIFWIRAAVVATHDKNDAARDVAEAQTVANAKAIANSIEPYYGQAASEQLFKLLAGHWGAVKAYLQSKDGSDQATGKKAEKMLFDNAEQIAVFLSNANPNWAKQEMLAMMNAHAGLHIRQIDQIYAGQYQQEAETWQAFVKNVTEMADSLATGLAKQFPEKF